MSVSKRTVSAVVITGPLASFKSAYAAEFRELGYTPSGVVKQLRRVARLSRWLERAGLTAGDVTGPVLERLLATDPELAATSAPGLAALFGLRADAGTGVKAGQAASGGVHGDLLLALRRHLLAERGIGAATADRYVHYARRFLAEQVGPADLRTLTSATVTRCVQREAGRVAVASTQYYIAGLRAFLRFTPGQPGTCRG